MQTKVRELVSVIVPAYRCERYIRACLDSLLEQTYQPLEVIVIYDPSPDNTLSILKGYGRDIILVTQKRKTNPATARNIGLNLAKGQFIAFCDADDCFETTKIEKQTKTIGKNKADFTYTDVMIIDNEGNLIEKKVKPQISRNNFDSWITDPFITFSSVLVKRELLEAVGGFDQSLDVVEDMDLMVRIIVSGQGKKTSGFLTYYRLHIGNISRNLLRGDFYSFKMLCKYGFAKQIVLLIFRNFCPHIATSLLRRPRVLIQELLHLINKNRYLIREPQ